MVTSLGRLSYDGFKKSASNAWQAGNALRVSLVT